MLEETGRNMEEEVLDKYKVDESKREVLRWNGGGYAKTRKKTGCRKPMVGH